MKLVGFTWGASANTVWSYALALCYSAAEYCAPVWSCSAHTSRVDVQLNSTMRLISGTPLLRQLHWLKAAERIDYKLALLVYKCRQGVAPLYLADELCQPADTEARCHLRSASTSSLIVRRTRLQPSVTELFQSFPSYLEQSSAARHVSTITGHLSQSPQDSSLQALLPMTSPFSCRAREVTCHYGHVNRFCYLLTYWPLMGGLTFGAARRGLGGSHPRCTKCSSPPINSQCTNFILFDVAV